MRGDQKWPPEEYKRQSEVDNEERRKLAQQPAFRPRRQQKVRKKQPFTLPNPFYLLTSDNSSVYWQRDSL